jgi:hypothetical protein
MLSEHNLKQAVLQTLDELPREKIVEVLDFVQFLKTQGVRERATEAHTQESVNVLLRTVPASHLDSLTGLVA